MDKNGISEMDFALLFIGPDDKCASEWGPFQLLHGPVVPVMPRMYASTMQMHHHIYINICMRNTYMHELSDIDIDESSHRIDIQH